MGAGQLAARSQGVLQLVLLPGSRCGRRPGQVRSAATCSTSRRRRVPATVPVQFDDEEPVAGPETLPSTMLAGVRTTPRCAGTTMKRSACPCTARQPQGSLSQLGRAHSHQSSAPEPPRAALPARRPPSAQTLFESDSAVSRRTPADDSGRAEERRCRCFGHGQLPGSKVRSPTGGTRRPEPAPTRFAVGGRPTGSQDVQPGEDLRSPGDYGTDNTM